MGKPLDDYAIVYGFVYRGQRSYCCPPIAWKFIKHWYNREYNGDLILNDPVVDYQLSRINMSDSLNLAGPDANMERETFLEEQARAEKLDDSNILSLLSKTFVENPEKTIDEMTAEEVLKHKYTLEETVRTLRVHLLVTARAEQKYRANMGKKVLDGLDKNFKPKPVPEARQATSAYEKLIQEIMVKMDISREEAEQIMKK
jgi:hypothetical protein